jgi:replication factor A1
MEVDQIVEKIVEETELDEEEVRDNIEEKMDEFEGLVSEEGAVHLVAKEHGVPVAEAAAEDLKIENIVPDMRKVTLKTRVVDIQDVNTFERDDGEEGKVQNVVLGDDTGTIRMTLWDDQTEIAEQIDEGDAIELAGAYTLEDDRGNAELRLGDSATVKMADEDDVPEVETMETSEVEIREVMSENTTYRIKGMLMAVYTNNPFYKICPECESSVRQDNDYECEEHGDIEPENALAISGVLDDGTENIRIVFFREQGQELLGIDEETVKDGDQDAIEQAAEESLGKRLAVEGRTRYNDYFGRIEMIGNEMEELDTEDEIQNLLEIMEV